MPEDVTIAPWARDLGLVVDIRRFLCPPATIRILMVVDGSVGYNKDFGLGLIVKTLRTNALSYVRFDVDLATRESGGVIGGDSVQRGNHPTYTLDYDGFKFDRKEANGTNTIDKYDQIWMFGIQGEQSAGLSADELAALHAWMDGGGGILAMGDHEDLGAAMCKDIQRVRSMRRWTSAQGVPPAGTSSRHDTNRPATPGQESGADFMPFALQEDNTLQPLEWRRYPLAGLTPIYRRRVAPHPILCDPVHGVLDVFPDHPHEGWVYEDAETVAIDGALPSTDYPGPSATRPMPETIAWVRTWTGSSNRAKGALDDKRFGALGAYDGQAAGVGRIVVDSTWHHWMTINLLGMEAADSTSTNYARFQTFVRNIGIWLATPAQRKTMLCAGTWLTFFTPELVEVIGSKTALLYEPARDVLGRSASKCLRIEWLLHWFPKEVLFPIERLDRDPWPCLTCPPWEILEAEIFQGILETWQPMVMDILQGRLKELPLDRISAQFDEGAARGRERALRSWRSALRRGQRDLEVVIRGGDLRRESEE